MSHIERKSLVGELVTSGPELEAIQLGYVEQKLTPPCAYRGNVHIFNDSNNFPAAFWDSEIVLGLGKNLTDKKWKCPRTTVGGFFATHLFHHVEQEKKEGRAFLQGALAGSERKSQAMTKNYVMVFDIDNGQKMDEVREMLIMRDLFAFLYTSHSHQKGVTSIKKDLLTTFIQNDLGCDIHGKGEVTADHARRWLAQEKGYLPEVVDVCELGGWEATPNGEMLIVRHRPLDRFRIVFPLARSFDFHASLRQADQITLWKDSYVGVADALGVFIDSSCCDPARLMYLPAHPSKGEMDWKLEMVLGKPLDLADHKPLDHRQYLKERKHSLEGSNPYLIAGGQSEPSRNQIENKWLIAFRDRYGSDLAFVDLVKDHYGDDCPRADYHTDSRNGFTCNDGDGEAKGFHAHCYHTHCMHLNGDPLAWLDFIVSHQGLNLDDLLQFVPANLRMPMEGDRHARPDLGANAVLAMIGALPSPVEKPDLPLEDTLAILEAAAVSNDPADKVRAFEALKPYRRPRKDLETLFEGARQKILRTANNSQNNDRVSQGRADNKMAWMNERFAVVKVGGSVKLVDLQDPDGYSFMSKFDFKTLLENKFILKGDDRRPLADEWLKWSDRKTFEGVEFAPGGGRPGFLNLFTGFPFKPTCVGAHAGDGWKLLETHIFENLCHRNLEWYEWLITWFADIIQNPETKRGSCVIVRGEEGVGKSIVFDLFRELLGNSAVKVDSLERLTGRFNSSLSAKVLAHLDEGVWAGNRAEQSKMKNLITSPSMFIERKGLEGWEEPNFIRVAITSNDRFLMSMTEGDRRNFVLECGKARQNDTLFFKQMVEEMRNGGFEAWMYDLMNWEPDAAAGGWEVLRKPPTTPWASEQMALSKRPEDRFFERLKLGEEIDHPHCLVSSIQLSHDSETVIRREDLAAQFDAYMGSQRSGRELIDNPTALAKLCEQHFPGMTIRRRRDKGERGRKYIFPPLSTLADMAA